MASIHVYNWKRFFKDHNYVLLGFHSQCPYWKLYAQKKYLNMSLTLFYCCDSLTEMRASYLLWLDLLFLRKQVPPPWTSDRTEHWNKEQMSKQFHHQEVHNRGKFCSVVHQVYPYNCFWEYNYFQGLQELYAILCKFTDKDYFLKSNYYLYLKYLNKANQNHKICYWWVHCCDSINCWIYWFQDFVGERLHPLIPIDYALKVFF